VPKVAKPGPTEFAIAICHLVNTKCHKNSVSKKPIIYKVEKLAYSGCFD